MLGHEIFCSSPAVVKYLTYLYTPPQKKKKKLRSEDVSIKNGDFQMSC